MKRQDNPNTRKDIDKVTDKAHNKHLKKRDQLISRLHKTIRLMRTHGLSTFRIKQEVEIALR